MSRKDLTWDEFVEAWREHDLQRMRDKIFGTGPWPCVQCGVEVEEARRVYAHPTCYACLPPPKPLPIIGTPKPK